MHHHGKILPWLRAINCHHRIKNESVGTQDEPLTTEEFHKQIEANTAKLNNLRLEYANKMSDLHDKYNDELDGILALEHQATDELHDARKMYEEAKVQYELELRELIKQRTEAGHRHNVGKAKAKNFWTTENEKIQSERNRIFKRYRDSGGGYFRKKPKASCTQVGRETRKEE